MMDFIFIVIDDVAQAIFHYNTGKRYVSFFSVGKFKGVGMYRNSFTNYVPYRVPFNAAVWDNFK